MASPVHADSDEYLQVAPLRWRRRVAMWRSSPRWISLILSSGSPIWVSGSRPTVLRGPGNRRPHIYIGHTFTATRIGIAHDPSGLGSFGLGFVRISDRERDESRPSDTFDAAEPKIFFAKASWET